MNIGDGAEDTGEIDFSFAEVAGIIFQVELADTIFAEPANFLDHFPTIVSRIADVVVDAEGGGADAVEDADILFGGVGIFESEEDTGFFGFLWYAALMVGAWFVMFRLKEPHFRNLAIAVIASYAFIGLFERRAINGANPMSYLFLIACFAAFRERAVETLRLTQERRWAAVGAWRGPQVSPASALRARGRAAH